MDIVEKIVIQGIDIVQLDTQLVYENSDMVNEIKHSVADTS